MDYVVLREEHLPNGMVIQIIKTNEDSILVILKELKIM